MRILTSCAFVAFAALALSGCGGDYTPTNTAPESDSTPDVETQEPAQPEVEDGSSMRNQASGPSMIEEYRREMEAAFAAHDEYEDVRRDAEARKEPYIKWAEHLYAALAYANIHERNGHSRSELPRYHRLRKLRSGDFKYAQGPSDDPRVKAALQNWTESTN